jgi:release factor H-coupled RctB family protein
LYSGDYNLEIIDLRISQEKKDTGSGSFNPYFFQDFGLKKIILLPDFYPGRSKLPVGTVALFNKNEHKIDADYIGRDIGCGMSLFKTEINVEKIKVQDIVDRIDSDLTKNETIEFTLGNHFIDLCKDKDNYLNIVIHAGYKKVGEEIQKRKFFQDFYLKEVEKNIQNASVNRQKLAKIVYNILNIDFIPSVLDKPHNTICITNNGILYRKGAAALFPGELSVLPSNLIHPIFLIRGRKKIQEIENSFCHGTGRKHFSSDLTQIITNYNELRRRVKIPKNLSNSDLQILNPTGYFNFSDYYSQFTEYIDIEEEFHIIGYIGYKRG